MDPLFLDALRAEGMTIATQTAIALLALASSALTGALAWLAKRAADYMGSRAHLASLECATTRMTQAANAAVEEIEQTLVKSLKAEDAWTAESARAARDEAMAIAMRHLGTRGLAEIRECLGHGVDDVRAMLRSFIEARVASKR